MLCSSLLASAVFPATKTPDVVLKFDVTKENAKTQYLGRGRDGNDSVEKLEKRFDEYEKETPEVEEAYAARNVLITVCCLRFR